MNFAENKAEAPAFANMLRRGKSASALQSQAGAPDIKQKHN
jgi:hypothetical protein